MTLQKDVRAQLSLGTRNNFSSNRRGRRLVKFAIVLALTAAGLSSCNYNDSKNLSTSPTKSPESGSEAGIDFQTVKKLVFDSACIKCHGPTLARAGLRLDTFDATFPNIDVIRTEVEGGTMPPPPPRGAVLSSEQKALLLAWIDTGAPEKSNAVPGGSPVTGPPGAQVPVPAPMPTPEPPQTPEPVPSPTPAPGPATATPDFAMVSQSVFQPHCVKCHGATSTKGGVDLESYANAARHAAEIGTSLDTDDMPRRAPPLPDDLKAIVYAWIAAGAPETVAPPALPGLPALTAPPAL